MPLSLHSFGTASPDHSMSQQEATQLAIDVCAVNERQQRMLKILYRKSGVESRQTVLPHRIATSWVTSNGTEGSPSPDCWGPSTEERMRFFQQHAGPLACEATRKALAASRLKGGDISHLVTVSCTGFGALVWTLN